MKTQTAIGAIAIGVLALSNIAAHEGIETQDFVMNGANEVLEVGGPDDADDTSYKGDSAGRAVAHLHIPEDDGTAICLHASLTKDLSEAAGALTTMHIHLGARDEAGPVSVNLTPLVADLAADGFVDACIDNPVDGAGNPVAGATLADIVLDGRSPNGTTNGHPSGFTNEYYLNLHSEAFPAGALRGQIKGQQYKSSQRPTPNAG